MPDDRRARLRAADADRELVHEILSAAMAHGSLSPVEYEERAGKAVLAKTFGDLDALTDEVRGAAYKVIQGKGATNYAIGLSSARIVEAILDDDHAVMPVSTVLDGFHGVSGVALSVPSVVSAAGAEPIRETSFDEKELGLFRHSADALREVADSLR